MQLSIQPLSRALFEPYGDVIDLPPDGPAEAGRTQRFPDVALLDFQGQTPALDLLYSAVRPPTVDFLERHRNSTQTFLPLRPVPFVVVVGAPAVSDGDAVDPGRLKAFLSTGHQGVSFRPGVWHHPLLPVGAPLVSVILHRSPDRDLDTQTVRLVDPVLLLL